MKECTFQPEINQSISDDLFKSKLEHSVSGIESYLAQRDRAERLRQEQKAREEKAFHIEKKYNPHKHYTYTKAQPFKLSNVQTCPLSFGLR